MRIIVVSTPVFQLPLKNYGGLEEIAWLCAKGFAEQGHSVALVAPDGSTCPGVEIIEVGPAGAVSEEMAYGGFGEMRDRATNEVIRGPHPGFWQKLLDADVIVDHSWGKFPYMLKGEGKLKAPVLGVMHAPVHTMYQTWPPNYPAVVEKACPVCISKDQAAHFEALHGRPARWCYNGVDAGQYRALGVPRTDRYLFLARFSTIKCPDLCIDACQKAGAELDLIGDRSITNEPAFYEQCEAKCDGQRIRMVGSVPRGETVWWYSQAKAMLHLTQRFREPFGLAPVESMCCGTPVIAWNYGAMKETVKHGETGFLVDSVDEAAALIRDRAVERIDRAACRAWAVQFSVERMVSRYLELIDEAVRTGGW